MLNPRRLALASLLPLAALCLASSSHPMEVRDAQRVLITGDIIFKTNSPELEPKSEAALAKIAAAIKKIPAERKIRIGVHSDTRGADSYNLAMSQRRAASVADWLAHHGVSCQRLVPVGYGESRPITYKGSKQKINRRVEVVSIAPDSNTADAADGGALAEWTCR